MRSPSKLFLALSVQLALLCLPRCLLLSKFDRWLGSALALLTVVLNWITTSSTSPTLFDRIMGSKLSSAQRSKTHQAETTKDHEERKKSRQQRLKESEAKWKRAQEKTQSSPPANRGGKR